MDWFREHIINHHPRKSELTDREVHNLIVDTLRYTHDTNVRTAIQFLRARVISIECPPAGSGVSLFTCDNPVLMCDPEGAAGLARETTVIRFPLNRRIFVRLAGRSPMSSDHSHELRVHHDRDIIDNFNRSVIQNATDEVYASDKSALYTLLCDIGYRPKIQEPRVSGQ